MWATLFVYSKIHTHSAGYDYFSLNSTSIEAETGESVAIGLNTSANPLPVFSVITFIPDNAGSERARYTISDNFIMLTDLREENSGSYTVEGRNFADVRVAQFSLIVMSGTCTIVKLYSECMVVHITSAIF